MKLRDFLKKFENIDPEIEVFQFHWFHGDKLEKLPEDTEVSIVSIGESHKPDLFNLESNSNTDSIKGILIS